MIFKNIIQEVWLSVTRFCVTVLSSPFTIGTLIVTKIDRLARSVADLVRLTEQLRMKGVHLRFLANPEMNTESANGKLMLTVLGAIAEFERDLMLERQREGIAKAKAEGKYKGRKPTARAKSAEVVMMKAEDKITDTLGRIADHKINRIDELLPWNYRTGE